MFLFLTRVFKSFIDCDYFQCMTSYLYTSGGYVPRANDRILNMSMYEEIQNRSCKIALQ